jgi:glycosyltransferase involved in cell wall biosynthesis
METELKLSIVLPCLNEAETLETVIRKAKKSIQDLNVVGEVVVADNGSNDGSQLIARACGAKLVDVAIKGYGAALQEGISEASGTYIIMGDADDSYALDDLKMFIAKLDEGYDLVMGNRFQGGIAPGAMPWLHRYFGNPILSYLGRLLYRVPIGDFHCGLRAFKTDSIRGLNLKSPGMEFASEMVVKASLNKLKITEVSTTLKPDGRSRPPHLRTWRDGWRHLIFLLAASPRWLFLYPGLFLLGLGSVGLVATGFGHITIGALHLGINSYLLSIAFSLVGFQTILTGVLARIFSSRHGFLPVSKKTAWIQNTFTLERGIVLSLFLIMIAVIGFGVLIFNWTGSGFRNFNTEVSLKISGFFILSLVSGIQTFFASFFASILQVD